MSDLKDKAKDKIDKAAKATKEAVGQAIDKTKKVTHKAGEKMENGGKTLKGA